MPGSVIQGKAEIKDWINKHQDIKTIVDVGAGGCTYPQLLGDKYEFIAVEVWAPYVKQFNYQDYYKDVIIGEAQHLMLPDADCIIFGDVLEHMEKKEGVELLQRSFKQYKHVIVSLPVSDEAHRGLLGESLGAVRPAKEHFGNWFEYHKSPWYYSDLEKLTNWSLKLFAGKNEMGIFAK